MIGVPPPLFDVLGAVAAMRSHQNMANIQCADMARAYQNAYKPTEYKPFPRSREQRIRRMERFIEWKREQRSERFWRRLWLGVGFSIGTPLVLAAVTWCWRFAVASIVS